MGVATALPNDLPASSAHPDTADLRAEAAPRWALLPKSLLGRVGQRQGIADGQHNQAGCDQSAHCLAAIGPVRLHPAPVIDGPELITRHDKGDGFLSNDLLHRLHL